MLPVLITVQLSLLIFLCASSLVYVVQPITDYNKEIADAVRRYTDKRNRKTTQQRKKKKKTSTPKRYNTTMDHDTDLFSS